ncbi:oxidoreductase, zinc-binding dehydrogenase family protein, partial [Ancylostoma caninum]
HPSNSELELKFQTGKYNLCPEVRFFAAPPIDGSLARYIVHDADFCFKRFLIVNEKPDSHKLRAVYTLLPRGALATEQEEHNKKGEHNDDSQSVLLPDGVTYEEGALMEPLSVAVHACRRARVQIGQRILVQGAGPVGILCMMAARAVGVAQVVITDLNSTRVQLAKKLGAEHTICVDQIKVNISFAVISGMSVNEVRTAVIECLRGEPEVTIECTGAQSCLESSILTTRSGGVIVLVGLGSPRAELPIVDPTLREVDIIGVFRYANCYPIALNLVASGRVDLSGLTRAHYKLEEAVEAFKRTQQADVMKVFITCHK